MAVTRNNWMRRLATGLPRWTMSVGLMLVFSVAAQASDYFPRYRGDQRYSDQADRLLRSLDRGDRPSRYDDFRGGSYLDDAGYRGSYSTGNPRRYEEPLPGGSSYDSYDAPSPQYDNPTPRRPRLGSEYDDRAPIRSQLRDPLTRTRPERMDRRLDRPRYDDLGSDRLGSDRLNVRLREETDRPRREERFRPSYDRIDYDRGLDQLRPERGLDRPEYDRGPDRGPGYDRPLDELRRNPEHRRPNGNPGPIPPNRRPEDQNDAQQRQRKIAARYGNPVMQRFVQNVSPQQGVRIYQEAMQLIDTRHLQPSPYEARVRSAMTNLVEAAGDRGFQQVNGVSLSGQQIAGLQSSLAELLSSRPIQSSTDAANMLQWTMDAAGRQAGIRPGAVALEFVCGATDSLDKYSAFMPEDPNGQPSADKGGDKRAAILDDHVVGIGVEIKPDERGALIKKALPGGPAAEAGLQAGDLIVAVDGHALAGQTLDYAVDLITGRAGTRLQLAVMRGERQASMTLVRRQVAVASVSEVQMLDPQNGVGYIRLEKFAQSSDQEVDKALWTLHQQGMQSLVFDVRGNPGGLLTTAVSLADKFLPGGTIVSTRGRTPADNTSEQAKKPQTWKTPMVVLIDEDSASASEIFAAAIQDNHRGIVMGRHSYGKGTVQTHFPMQSIPGYLKLTTAKFYSPSGREMAGQGVEPDVVLNGKRNDEQTVQNDSDIVAAIKIAGSGQPQDMVLGRR